jgi:Transposase DDE domain
VNRKR